MAGREQPYDPPLPYDAEQGGSSVPPGGGPATDRIGSLMTELEEAKVAMEKNLQTAGQRGENIDSLQDKTENLAGTAQGFNRGSHKVRKQMWWKNVKMRIWIIVGIIILLIVIIVPSVIASK